MSKKDKHLYELLINREFLEAAADEAMKAVKLRGGREPNYLIDFKNHRKDRMDEIERMVRSREFPHKHYMKRTIWSVDKEREIETLSFYPWCIILHAIKRALEPTIARVLIYDSSAGTKGRGQLLGAQRVNMFLRRYRQYTHLVVSDCRLFYQSIPHWLARWALNHFIKDDLFMDVVEKVIFDYFSDVETMLMAEHERKIKHCVWADITPFISISERGVTIGGSVSQLIGNLTLFIVDYLIKRVLRLKVYHRHCDDMVIGVHSREEGEELLHFLDVVFNRLGLCLKSSSYVAPIKDEKKGINGRALSYCGYLHSRGNMAMRHRTKRRFAKKLHGVKSKRRRREIIAAYWGIAKWGKCKHLWTTILEQNGIMSFADVGIKTEKVRIGKDGKRMFDVPIEKVSSLADRKANIVIHDFEPDITMNGSKGRCVVLFHYADQEDDGKNLLKFVTTSQYIIDKLLKAKKMEDEGTTVFPQPTKIFSVRLGNGRHTYDIE